MTYLATIELSLHHTLACTPCFQTRIFFAFLEGRKWSAVKNFKNAISRHHLEQGWRRPPFDSSELSDFWRALKKRCDNTQEGKDAVHPGRLRIAIAFWLQKGSNVAVRNAFIAAVQFWGVKRFDEVRGKTNMSLWGIGIARLTPISRHEPCAFRRMQVKSLRRADIKGSEETGYSVIIGKQKNRPNERQTIYLPARAYDGFPVSKVVSTFLAATESIPSKMTLARSCDSKNIWQANPLSNSAWNKALRAGFEAAGVPKSELQRISSHSLRKGGFTAMIRAGVPFDVAQQIIGHKSAESARPYLRRPQKDLLAAAKSI
jgi:hypothetical protein